MEKIQVYRPKEELEALRGAAARAGRSVADIILEARRQVVLKPQASGPVALWGGQQGRISIDHDSIYDERNSLPPPLADVAVMIDLSAHKKHYLRLWGYGRNLSARQQR